MAATISIRNNHGLYSFEVTATNGDRILRSDKFRSAFLCTAAVKSLQQNSRIAERYEKIDLPTGQHYFVIKDENNEVLATSDTFWSAVSRNYALTIAKRECEGAVVLSG